jgi:predicted ArsR family transcriptional regulator
MPSDPRAITAVAALEEPARRALYEWVAAAGRAVSRDEAATATGVSRALAAFHLDRLVKDGLLEPEYRRLTGRTGPGAGRPAKLYRRADREIAVTLPERRYDVAADLLATALEDASRHVPPAAVRSVARQAGRVAGAFARTKAGPRPSRARRRTALLETLRDRGYEPREAEAGEIRFANCPFDALVEDHRDLVCGMNLSLAEGLVEGLGGDTLTARLDPQPGVCCVALEERKRGSPR